MNKERLCMKVCEEDGIRFLGKKQTTKWIEYLDGKYWMKNDEQKHRDEKYGWNLNE